MNDETLMLNPKINGEVKKEFEKNIFDLKQSNGTNKSVWVRACVDKFNQDPPGFMKYINKK